MLTQSQQASAKLIFFNFFLRYVIRFFPNFEFIHDYHTSSQKRRRSLSGHGSGRRTCRVIRCARDVHYRGRQDWQIVSRTPCRRSETGDPGPGSCGRMGFLEPAGCFLGRSARSRWYGALVPSALKRPAPVSKSPEAFARRSPGCLYRGNEHRR